MGKTDIESAFRLIPVHPDDWELLGMCWNGQYYFDKALPFGLRFAPYIFNQLWDAIEWILLNECSISFVCHILDDFLIVEPPCHTPPPDSLCRASLSSMILTFQKLNIPISTPKTEGPSQIIQFMGIILDSGKMEARLPEDKVERIKSALSTFQSQRSTTLQELQSLIGTLNFACKVIPPGRPFLQRIIHLTRGYWNVEDVYRPVEWNRTIPIPSVGNLWHPVFVYRCLWLPGLWGNFPKKVVSGKVAPLSTTRPGRDQHSLARTICN